MKHLSQQDPRWHDVLIGPSPYTIAKYGCTLTSISMLSDYFGCYVPPNEIASHKDWFLKDGRILWNKLKFDNLSFDWREYKEDVARIKESLKDPNKAVILEVNSGKHWVVATAPVGDDFWIIDPWDAKKKQAKQAYRNITGAAFFHGDYALVTKPEETVKPGLIRVADKPEIWLFDGDRRFWVTDESTMNRLKKTFGDDPEVSWQSKVRTLSVEQMAKIPTGEAFTKLK